MIDGLLIILILVALVAGVVLFGQAPRYRCQVCSSTFSAFPHLLDHEAQHFPRRCTCSGADVHHPSCPARPTLTPRRAA